MPLSQVQLRGPVREGKSLPTVSEVRLVVKLDASTTRVCQGTQLLKGQEKLVGERGGVAEEELPDGSDVFAFLKK